MSIIDQQLELENLPDQQLMQLGQQPDPRFPMYLVVSEVERRRDMRQRYEAEMAKHQAANPPDIATQRFQELGGGIASADPAMGQEPSPEEMAALQSGIAGPPPGGPPPGGPPPMMAAGGLIPGYQRGDIVGGTLEQEDLSGLPGAPISGWEALARDWASGAADRPDVEELGIYSGIGGPAKAAAAAALGAGARGRGLPSLRNLFRRKPPAPATTARQQVINRKLAGEFGDTPFDALSPQQQVRWQQIASGKLPRVDSPAFQNLSKEDQILARLLERGENLPRSGTEAFKKLSPADRTASRHWEGWARDAGAAPSSGAAAVEATKSRTRRALSALGAPYRGARRFPWLTTGGVGGGAALIAGSKGELPRAYDDLETGERIYHPSEVVRDPETFLGGAHLGGTEEGSALESLGRGGLETLLWGAGWVPKGIAGATRLADEFLPESWTGEISLDDRLRQQAAERGGWGNVAADWLAKGFSLSDLRDGQFPGTETIIRSGPGMTDDEGGASTGTGLDELLAQAARDAQAAGLVSSGRASAEQIAAQAEKKLDDWRTRMQTMTEADTALQNLITGEVSREEGLLARELGLSTERVKELRGEMPTEEETDSRRKARLLSRLGATLMGDPRELGAGFERTTSGLTELDETLRDERRRDLGDIYTQRARGLAAERTGRTGIRSLLTTAAEAKRNIERAGESDYILRQGALSDARMRAASSYDNMMLQVEQGRSTSDISWDQFETMVDDVIGLIEDEGGENALARIEVLEKAKITFGEGRTREALSGMAGLPWLPSYLAPPAPVPPLAGSRTAQ